MIALVIHNIRRKLLHWSSKKLPLAGHIIVANHVLLATTWYNLSCWTIFNASIHQIQQLVCNYIWSVKEDHAAQAKVAWPILTSPKARGGLGLIDPLSQSKVVLAKFVVRGLQPGDDYWKMLLRYSSLTLVHKKGSTGPPQTGWILNMNLKPSFSCQLEDRFSASMWKAWCEIRRGLKCDQPNFEPA